MPLTRPIFNFASLAAAVAAAAVPLPSFAETDYYRHDFTGEFFLDSPVPEVKGYFTMAVDITTGLESLFDVDVTIGTTHFTTANSGGTGQAGAGGLSRAGGVLGGPFNDDYTTLSTGTNDWATVLYNTNPRQSYFFYTLEGWAGLAEAGKEFSEKGKLTYATTQVFPSPVPEPATWALLIGGLGIAAAPVKSRSSSPHLPDVS